MKNFLPLVLVFGALALAAGCGPEAPATEPGDEDATAVPIRFHIASDSSAAGLVERDVRGEDALVYLEPEPVLTEDHIERVEVAESDMGAGLRLILTDEGRGRLREATAENEGRRFAVIVGEEVVSAPRIREALDTQQILVTGTMTDEEVRDVAATFGALDR